MVKFTRKTFLCSLFVLASVAASLFSLRYFSSVFPIVNLDIRMSRTQALADAATTAKQYNIGPSEYKQAALFNTDSTVQTYVELEAGGAVAYNEMVKGNLYSPYTWQVRHVKPFETHELIVIFKPDGTPYGFVETIAESTPGEALSPEQAEVIARQQAQSWHINFNEYTRVEISKETRPNGRIDHTFVYERPEARIGKATYRLSIVVSGDKLTAVTHFVKVPEEFIHHYQEMRSANNTLATASQLAMMVLYMLGIGIVGLFFLLRKKYLVWKTPLLWGCIITTLTSCASLSNFPLLWFSYTTTTPVNTFIIQYLFVIAIGLIINLAINTTIFMIAESLTRLALPAQGQLWKTWSLSGGSSWQVLGRTASAYLLVPLYFADTVIFYMITMRYLGWWVPASQLTDPNILASYVPWINAVAPSLSAGFLEECLFRAFPLAAAILLGRRYGKQNWWIAGAFIIQIIIFGSAHANYAMQPAYARLVELVVFSSLMGIIYLKFGLLIGIISHAVYDLVWFSLPLFISCAPYAWINQLFVILVSIIPLIIILVRRIQRNSWHTLDSANLNQAWQPEPVKEHAPRIIEQSTSPTFTKKHLYSIIGAGIIGIATWLLCTRFTSDAQPINMQIIASQEAGRKALASRGSKLDDSWTTLAYVSTFNIPTLKYALPGVSSVDQHRFIWQKGGLGLYKTLLGSYLQPALWNVRFLKFNGSVSDRAEEYFVSLSDTSALRIKHTLPEDRKGEQLSESDARIKAHKALRELYNREPETFKEISAVSAKQPDRLDWNFTFADSQQNMPDNAQARILITISGDQLTDNCRYIHVPEDWVRTQETERATFSLINIICSCLLFALLLMACIFVFRGTRFSIQRRYAITIFGTILIVWIVQTINGWPSLMAQILNAQEPYLHQLFRLIGGMSIGLLCGAGAYTIAILMILQHSKAITTATNKTNGFLLGSALGLCWAGLLSLLKYIAPSIEPFWGDFSCLGSYIPALAVPLNTLSQFIMQTLFVLLMIYLLNIFKHNKARYILQIGMILILGFTFMGAQPILSINHYLLSGLVVSLFFVIAYYGILAYLPTITPWIIAAAISCQLIQQAILALYPSAIIANSLAVVIVLLSAWLWHKAMKSSIQLN